MRREIEGAEQATLMDWAALMAGRWPELQLLFHVPNGGARGKAEAARMKRQGVKAGVPDLMLPVARGGYHGLFLEMKAALGRNLHRPILYHNMTHPSCSALAGVPCISPAIIYLLAPNR